jgi:hypothetical protein
MKTQTVLCSLFLNAALALIAAPSQLGPAVIAAGAARLDNGSLVTLGQPLAGVFGTPGAGVSGSAGFIPVFQTMQSWPPPPQIAPGFGLTGTNFHLSFQADVGHSYAVEASTNLTDWTPLWSAPGTGAAVQFTDPDALRYDRRFYRVVTQ